MKKEAKQVAEEAVKATLKGKKNMRAHYNF
jgi:hypothetical protein